MAQDDHRWVRFVVSHVSEARSPPHEPGPVRGDPDLGYPECHSHGVHPLDWTVNAALRMCAERAGMENFGGDNLRCGDDRRRAGGIHGGDSRRQHGLKVALIERQRAGRHVPARGLHSDQGAAVQRRDLGPPEARGRVRHRRRSERRTLDWAAVQKRKNAIMTKHVKGLEFLMKKNKVTVIAGFGG